MTPRIPTLLALAVLVAVLIPNAAVPQEDGGMNAEMMKKYAELAKPGPQHKLLGTMIGEFDTTMRVYMMPGKPPMESKGTATSRWLIDGKWLATEWTGKMMGAKMNGFGIMGFDNHKKKFISMSVDNLNHFMQHSEGVVCDRSGKVIVTYGHMDEFLMGEHDKQVKYVTRLLSADKHVYEVWDLGIGESGRKVVEITAVRRK